MMLDVINQDFIIPTIKNIAKLSADFKQGVEEIYTNQDNNQETLLIDDYVRQSDYKYTYSDRNVLNDKYANADMVAQSIEKFAQLLPLDIAEIFTWYFEQKGVENPERFLDQEKLQFMKQNEKIQMLAQNNNTIGQLAQMIPNQNVDTQEQIPTEQEEVQQQHSVLPKLYELAKKHILSENKEG